MTQPKTVFQRIIDGELPAARLYEDAHMIAIKDQNPVAPVHVLIIPKKRLRSIDDATGEDAVLLGQMVLRAAQIARDLGGLGLPSGYRVVFNTGADAGQTVFWLHLHLIGGRELGGMA